MALTETSLETTSPRQEAYPTEAAFAEPNQEVKDYLLANWDQEKPTYGEFNWYDAGAALKRYLEAIERHGIALDQKDIDQSWEFLYRVFNDYENPEKIGSAKHAFIIPTRIKRDTDTFASEITPFLPVLEHADPFIKQHIFSKVPPYVVDTYQNGDETQGLVIYTPVMWDMVGDLRVGFRDQASKIVAETAEFARDKFGVELIGLGGILAGITKMGEKVGADHVTTTTGHGGTVWLLGETIKQGLEQGAVQDASKIAVIGAEGLIGRSASRYISHIFPDAQLILNDVSFTNNGGPRQETLDFVDEHDSARLVGTAREAIKQANIAMIAINGSLSEADLADLDLTGKLIIDDSQPPGVLPSQIEDRGGVLAWVVGQDATQQGLLTRRGYRMEEPFNYGADVGLERPEDVWGCELEVAALSISGLHERAIHEPASPDQVAAIGEIVTKSGLAKSSPLQRFGQASTA